MTDIFSENKKQIDLPNNIQDIISKLKMFNNHLILIGSASLQNQIFTGDYDFMSNIGNTHEPLEVYQELNKILNYITTNNQLYFIELKLQSIDGEKRKWNNKEEVTFQDFEESFKNISYIKIDFILNDNNIFTEVSVNYNFEIKENNNDIISSLLKEIQKLKDEGKYYKMLKRKYSIYLNLRRTPEIIKLKKELTKIFNGDLGKLYKKKSNLEALDLLHNNYKDDDTKSRILLNLREIGEKKLNINKMKNLIENYNKILNKEAQKLNKFFPLP